MKYYYNCFIFVWYCSVFTQYSYYCDLLCSGPSSRLCDHRCHVWVRYINTTEITVWCMPSILVHMTYFSFYTIFISEHYREIVSYSPTPIQTFLKYYYILLIKVTVSLCYLLFCFNAWHFYITKYGYTLHSHSIFVLGA